MLRDVAPGLYGLLVEFEHAEDLVSAAARAKNAGYDVEAYAPHPVEGLSDALRLRPSRVPKIVLSGAILGALTGFGLQYYVNVVDYPLNIGGRPLNSWPAFIPITFELAILFGSIAAFLGMLALNGFPRPYHPLFNVPRFALASRNRFFLVLRAGGERFDPDDARRFLQGFKPHEITEVAR